MLKHKLELAATLVFSITLILALSLTACDPAPEDVQPDAEVADVAADAQEQPDTAVAPDAAEDASADASEDAAD